MITDDEILRMARQHGDCITVFGGDEYVFDEAGLCALVKEASAAVPEGWKLVPKEPTHFMVQASWECSGLVRYTNGEAKRISIAYQSMLDAAPIPTEAT